MSELGLRKAMGRPHRDSNATRGRSDGMQNEMVLSMCLSNIANGRTETAFHPFGGQQ